MKSSKFLNHILLIKDQNIISDEAEWKKFMEVNATILPTAFRITGSRR